MYAKCIFVLLEPPKDLIRKLLVVDPKQRISIEEALDHPFFQTVVRKGKHTEPAYIFFLFVAMNALNRIAQH